MKYLCVIQARSGSTRLPGKVLKKVEDKTVLEHVIDRVSKSKLIEEIIVATTVSKEDLEIVKLCANKKYRVFCGSENDVLDKFYQISKLILPENIIRITSDCPLIDSDIIDKVIEKHIKTQSDYTSNCIPPTLPDGLDVEIFTFQALRDAWLNATLMSEREHVTPYLRREDKKYHRENYTYEKDYSGKRWTLDEKVDFFFVKEIYKRLYNDKPDFKFCDVLKVLEDEPELEKINNNINRNEGYQKSINEDKIMENRITSKGTENG